MSLMTGLGNRRPGSASAACVVSTVLAAWLWFPAAAPDAQAVPPTKWVTAWSASAHGPYPSGNAAAGPDLRFAFPKPASGAVNQSFRLMIRPGLWGSEIRLRFANTFGDRAIEFDECFVGVQATGGALVTDSNRRVRFGGATGVSIPAGSSTWSDPVSLDFVDAVLARWLDGRRLAVSFHVVGASGPMTWHAKAMTTSYLTPPGSGASGADDSDAAFCYSTASWFFLDALDVRAPAATRLIAALGDSITDGTNSTMNGDDRWPDVLARRLRAAYADRVVVVNQGIGGNRITAPAAYSRAAPVAGGPSAVARLDRDVLGLSGLTTIIWLEGINDFGNGGASVETVIEGMREVVQRVRSRGGIRLFAATLPSCLSSSGAYGTTDVDQKRRALNGWIRTSGIFDGVFEFDRATLDPSTGSIRAEFQPDSTVGGPGDLLHPNRAGLKAMAHAIDLGVLTR